MKLCKYFIFSLFLVGSCSDDERVPFIDPELMPYVERFRNEAEARGLAVDFSQLEASLVNEIGAEICGFGNPEGPIIGILNSEFCWSNQSEAVKEILFFHEIGHALLNRAHILDTLPNGDFKSMMWGGNSLLQFWVYNEFTPERRKYYLDELMDPSTSLPDWSLQKKYTSSVFALTDEIDANNSWVFSNTSNDSHKGSVNGNIFSSSSFSLEISSESSEDPSDFSTWIYDWINPPIPTGSRLELRVKIKTENLVGGGAYIAMRGDSEESESNPVLFYASPIDTLYLTGNQDFKDYAVTLKQSYFSGIYKLRLFLVLSGNTTGKVYFDDIRLVYHTE